MPAEVAPTGPDQDTRLKDPVCGMRVDPLTSKHRAVHEGHTYHFCRDACRTKFIAEPLRYLAPNVQPEQGARHTAKAEPPLPAGTIYICPMDPEVRQSTPGPCPICGMALEPELVTTDAPPNAELADMTRRFWIGLACAVPVVVLEMGGHVAGLTFLKPGPLSHGLQMMFAAPVILWAGWPLLQRGWMSLRTRNLNMFTLVAMGILVAAIYSVVATIFPGAFPAAHRLGGHTVSVYFEAASVITVLVLLGQVLELQAREQTSGAIRALLKLAPPYATRVKTDGTDELVPLESVAAGDRLRIKPGERVPVDGVVLEGHSSLDESLVTGEAMPVTKAAGAALIGGTINSGGNQDGSLVMRAEKVGRDTLLARIVQMVATAQRSRAPVQRLADRVAGWFVPLVLAVALVAFLAWMTWGPQPRLAFALIAAVSVLIIACPCALGLATPMSIMVGVGRGAQSGLLIRDAQALERMEAVDTIVVDKTGTLTEGRPSVTAITTAGSVSEDELLRLAASVERNSAHPLAKAIVQAALDRNLPLATATHFAEPAGKGVGAVVDGRRIEVGNARFLAGSGPAPEFLPPDLSQAAAALRREGATAVLVAIDGRTAGVIGIADAIKPTTPQALAALRAAGMRIVMLTGDNEITARAVAAKLSIEEVEADVLPDGKALVVQRLRAQGRVVAMAGDGVNDAPALAAADVGIAMGAGSDVALESAGITLVKGDLTGIVRARTLSAATMRNIRQNLFFAFVYNAVGVPIAAGVLYPAFGLLLSPVFAAAAMALSSVSVIGNALRLRSVRLS
jgi:P-type Cu+ transporter